MVQIEWDGEGRPTPTAGDVSAGNLGPRAAGVRAKNVSSHSPASFGAASLRSHPQRLPRRFRIHSRTSQVRGRKRATLGSLEKKNCFARKTKKKKHRGAAGVLSRNVELASLQPSNDSLGRERQEIRYLRTLFGDLRGCLPLRLDWEDVRLVEKPWAERAAFCALVGSVRPSFTGVISLSCFDVSI